MTISAMIQNTRPSQELFSIPNSFHAELSEGLSIQCSKLPRNE